MQSGTKTAKIREPQNQQQNFNFTESGMTPKR